MREPFAARLHPVTRLTSRLQGVVVRALRSYFARAPGWVLLTTQGRKTGLPREVLLPCERFDGGLIIISTYGRRSNWIRNIARDPNVRVTCAGWIFPARAEIIDDLDTKRSLIGAHPFFPALPLLILNVLHATLLRPIWIPALRRWVTRRPVILIRPDHNM